MYTTFRVVLNTQVNWQLQWMLNIPDHENPTLKEKMLNPCTVPFPKGVLWQLIEKSIKYVLNESFSCTLPFAMCP